MLDGAVVQAPGTEVQPDLSYCQQGDPPPCPQNTLNQYVYADYYNTYHLMDDGESILEHDARNWTGPSAPNGWDATPNENEILLDNALRAMEASAVQQIARGTSDKIAEQIASRTTSGSGTVFEGLVPTLSYGIRTVAARLAVF